MAFPNFKDKHAKDSMISPSEYKKYRIRRGDWPKFKPPKGIIFCYNSKLLKYILNNHDVKKVDGFFGDVYLLKDTKNKVGVVGNFGIGAPIAGVLLEELIEFGVRKFVSIGTAGTLQKDVNIGDIVVCKSAIRDEGTSHHYVKPSRFAYASTVLTHKICSELDKFGVPYRVGSSWTVDAPYRETVAEARKYQKEGVLTVEMEASALFAIAKFRGVQLGSIFTISDSLAELEWKPDFHSKNTKDALEKIYQVSVKILT